MFLLWAAGPRKLWFENVIYHTTPRLAGPHLSARNIYFVDHYFLTIRLTRIKMVDMNTLDYYWTGLWLLFNFCGPLADNLVDIFYYQEIKYILWTPTSITP